MRQPIGARSPMVDTAMHRQRIDASLPLVRREREAGIAATALDERPMPGVSSCAPQDTLRKDSGADRQPPSGSARHRGQASTASRRLRDDRSMRSSSIAAIRQRPQSRRKQTLSSRESTPRRKALDERVEFVRPFEIGEMPGAFDQLVAARPGSAARARATAPAASPCPRLRKSPASARGSRRRGRAGRRATRLRRRCDRRRGRSRAIVSTTSLRTAGSAGWASSTSTRAFGHARACRCCRRASARRSPRPSGCTANVSARISEAQRSGAA